MDSALLRSLQQKHRAATKAAARDARRREAQVARLARRQYEKLALVALEIAGINLGTDLRLIYGGARWALSHESAARALAEADIPNDPREQPDANFNDD